MDLRSRTTQALAGAGAILVVTGLSLGGGVAAAVADPATAGAPPSVAKATTSTSDQGQGNKSDGHKKDRSKRRSTTTTGADSSGTGSTDSGTTDSTGSNRSTGPTATTTPTTSPPTTTPTTTATPTTTRSTPTTTTPPTTTAPAGDSSGSDSSGSTGPSEGVNGGTYNGSPTYSGTQVDPDEGTTTTTAPSSRTPGPKSGSRPSSRSGSGLPPGIYPVSPGGPDGSSGSDDPAGNGTRAPSGAGAPAPIAAVPGPSTPVSTTQSPNQSTATPGAATDAGTVNPAPAVEPGSEVRDANQVTSESPAPTRRSRQLSQTGAGTRRLILLGGVALLIGAMVVAFTGRDGPILAAAAALPVGPGRRRPRPRKEMFGWEDGIPLAPAKRELARSRLGISGDPSEAYESYFDDEPGV